MVSLLATVTWSPLIPWNPQFNLLATMESMKLWVLPESTNTMISWFLVLPYILIVWQVSLPHKACSDIVWRDATSSPLTTVSSIDYTQLEKTSGSSSLQSMSSMSNWYNWDHMHLWVVVYFRPHHMQMPFLLLSSLSSFVGLLVVLVNSGLV